MNSQEIPEAGPVFLFVLYVSGWLDPVVHVMGLVLMAWAFWRSGKRGYLVVGCYFLFVLFGPLVMRAVKEVIDKRSGPNLSAQTQAKIEVAVQQAIDRVLEEGGHPPTPAQINVTIPVGPMLLVGGLWLIVKREARRDRDQPTAEHE